MTPEFRATLGQLAFTRGLEPAQLDRLATLATEVSWLANERIFREGDQNDFLYLMLDGHVALEISVPQRGRVRILTVNPGEVFGWSSVFYQKPKTANATAVEPTRALAINAAGLRQWSDADPRFGFWLARQLLQLVSERLKATRLQLIDVFKT